MSNENKVKLNIQYLISSLKSQAYHRKFRSNCYVATSIIFFILSIAVVCFKPAFDFIVSDGRGYYVYLPSIVIDGDLDFSNQILNHWGVDFNKNLLQRKTQLGYVHNKYPIGMAITLTPVFLFAHTMSQLIFKFTGSIYFSPDGYSILYQLFQLLFVMALGTIAMMLTDAILVQHFNLDGSNIFFAIMAYWIGSNYSYYYFREPFMIHIISSFWVTGFLYLTLKTIKQFQLKRPCFITIAFLVFCFSASIVCRPTNVVLFLFFPLIFFIAIEQKQLNHIVKWFPVLTLFTMPILLQLITWKLMSGHWIYYSYEGEGFIFSSPKFIKTLISSKHGLLFWSPILIYSFIGYWHRLTSIKLMYLSNEYFSLVLCFCFLLLWYINSSWNQWWFGNAFGGRAFIEFATFFILGLCFFFEKLSDNTGLKKKTLIISIFICMIYNYWLMGLYITHQIPRADYLF